MIWQDIVLSIGQWIFVLALVPALLSKDKPPFISSMLTGSILVTYVGVYMSFELWTAAVSTLLLSVVWLTLALQKYYGNKIKKLEKAAHTEYEAKENIRV